MSTTPLLSLFLLQRGDGGGGTIGESSSFSVKNTRLRRARSFSSISHSKAHFWATIYQGLKRVVPWKSRKSNQDGIVMYEFWTT
ncbi:uncharacterized protein At4g00950-like [Argentina anserina]|uniref:uncharacterized protein At4g00950-like n=1 Tax=Argentina anserina TaxID=57926 RepID=UPI0021761F6B|nr:uncharacterized protein At4g00950-like [Potentilla anserina]